MTIERDRMAEVITAIQELLADLGILCHPHKCELTPVNKIDYLGMQLDIPNCTFRLTARQLQKLYDKSCAILGEANKQRR